MKIANEIKFIDNCLVEFSLSYYFKKSLTNVIIFHFIMLFTIVVVYRVNFELD